MRKRNKQILMIGAIVIAALLLAVAFGIIPLQISTDVFTCSPDEVRVGDVLTISYQITNRAETEEPTTIILYIDQDDSHDYDTETPIYQETLVLQPGQVYARNYDWTVLAGYTCLNHPGVLHMAIEIQAKDHVNSFYDTQFVSGTPLLFIVYPLPQSSYVTVQGVTKQGPMCRFFVEMGTSVEVTTQNSAWWLTDVRTEVIKTEGQSITVELLPLYDVDVTTEPTGATVSVTRLSDPEVLVGEGVTPYKFEKLWGVSHRFSAAFSGYTTRDVEAMVDQNKTVAITLEYLPLVITFDPASVIEGDPLEVTVTAGGNPVEGAVVNSGWSTQQTTNSEGEALFVAPPVDVNTTYTFTATHESYLEGTSDITVYRLEDTKYCWRCGEDGEPESIAVGEYTPCGTGDAADYPLSETPTNCNNPVPGFEILTLVVSIGIAIFLLRRKKNER